MNFIDLIDSLKKRLFPPSYIASAAGGAGKVDGRVVCLTDSRARVAEQYNMLRANLCALFPENPIKAVTITSSQAQEGKTITCCNLASSLSQDKAKKTLLLDANLRNPAVHSMFGMPRDPGFVDILTGKAALETFTEKPAVGDLYVIPAGSMVNDPAIVLNPSELEPLLGKLKSVFDYVVIDTPAVQEFSDAGILGLLCDAVFLVVRAGVTQADIIEEAFSRLTEAQARPKACILTGVRDISSSQRSRDRQKYIGLMTKK